MNEDISYFIHEIHNCMDLVLDWINNVLKSLIVLIIALRPIYYLYILYTTLLDMLTTIQKCSSRSAQHIVTYPVIIKITV